MPTQLLRLTFLLATVCSAPAWLAPACLTAQESAAGQEAAAGQKSNAGQKTEPVETPPLSVESLFHPDDRFNYFAPAPPATRWLENSSLAIRQGTEWEVWDPKTGDKQPWDWPQQARQELGKLQGFSDRALDAAATNLASQAEHLDDPVMVRIGPAIAVVGGGEPPRLVTRDARGWQTPELSPDGSAIAYVRDNDLYVIKVDSGEILRLTQDGSETLLSGRLDWTYQEEIYGRGNFKGYWWSPDSRHLAFLKIDISQVLEFTLTRGSTPRGEALVARYPKAGDPIPLASLLIVNTDSLQTTVIHEPTGAEAETLVVRVTWRPDGRRLTYQIQNRIQTWLELRESDFAGSKPRVLLREEGPAWIEILGEPRWLPGGEFLWLSDLPAGRRHVWRVSEDGSRRIPITAGDWDVRDIVRVVADDRDLFVVGNRDGGIRDQHLYRVRWTLGSDPAAQVEALTTREGWHAPEVSPNGRWFTDTFSTLTTEPSKRLVEIDGSLSMPLVNDEEQSPAAWKSMPLSSPQWLDITTEDGVALPAYIIPPWNLDQRSANKQYPVLVYTYGGPQAPSAVNRWGGRNYLYHQLLAKLGIGVMVVDNRSSGGRGIADTWTVHRRMGVQELSDLLVAVAALKQLPWVADDRVAMRGWSFGGYYTAYAMTHSTEFAAGIAGGSVTDWRNYDAFYTERYMDTPQANEAGYEQTSVIADAKNLHGRILLVHGEVDDNVHPGNTLQLIAALQKAGKQFDVMFYPNAAHGVREPRQMYHLYRLMTDFLVRELKPQTDISLRTQQPVEFTPTPAATTNETGVDQ